MVSCRDGLQLASEERVPLIECSVKKRTNLVEILEEISNCLAPEVLNDVEDFGSAYIRYRLNKT
jgi:hypothetical protein